VFVQYIDVYGLRQTTLISAPPIGTYNQYMVLYNNTPGKFTFRINGVNIIAPVDASFVPTVGEIMGETHTLASQMPGGYNNPETFTDSHIYINGWQNFTGTAVPGFNDPDFAYYGSIALSNHLDDYAWDRACPN
jgi:hypothetical protein